VVILKDPAFLRRYDPAFQSAPTKNALEFGIFEGGSLLYFALAFPDFRFVGIDIRPPDSAVQDLVLSLGLEDRVKLYYETSQADETKLGAILEREFGTEPLGLVMDDASHQYALSRRSFELTFPRIAPGGTYCLEDWGWAHWPGFTQWTDQPALSNLIFEFVVLAASAAQWVSLLSIPTGSLAFVGRGNQSATAMPMNLSSILRLGDRKLTPI
jgi:hypothetical protein